MAIGAIAVAFAMNDLQNQIKTNGDVINSQLTKISTLEMTTATLKTQQSSICETVSMP